VIPWRRLTGHQPVDDTKDLRRKRLHKSIDFIFRVAGLFIESHSGRLWAVGTPGRGATFPEPARRSEGSAEPDQEAMSW
jgi:hypothetical protein